MNPPISRVRPTFLRALTSQIKGGLSTEALSSYPAMIQTECDRFFKEEMKLTQSTPGPKTVEIFKTMSSLIILTAARTLQGKEVRDSMDSRFAQLFHDLDGGFTPVNFLFPNLPLPSYRRRDKAQREMSDFYVNIMNKRDEGESEVSHAVPVPIGSTLSTIILVDRLLMVY